MSSYSTEPPLPDTTQWQPKKSSSEPLKSAFLARCHGIETLIHLRVQLEKEMNINNFDSGPGVEEIIRDELSRLLPTRYSVRAGTIVDQKANNGGDCDLVIFNDFWFPAIKAGATSASRKVHLPIDGVYAVGEIKQTLDFAALDNAMEKLVTYHRLDRPRTDTFRLVENQGVPGPCFHGLTNPLYSMIIATDLKDGIDLVKIVERFVRINKTVERLEVVRALCILGHATVIWGIQYEDQVGQALFSSKDLYSPIIPVWHSEKDSALYALIVDLLLNLNLSVLGAEDTASRYGIPEYYATTPASPDLVLQPDPKWLSIKNQPCGVNHNLDIEPNEK